MPDENYLKIIWVLGDGKSGLTEDDKAVIQVCSDY